MVTLTTSRRPEGGQGITRPEFTFAIKSIAFDEDYIPAENTRVTTNFANLARGASRRDNLRRALKMIDNRFNALAHWDNPTADRYSVGLEIISAEMSIAAGDTASFPLIEILRTVIIDRKADERIDGIVGNNFSSYVRDYDFSVVLPTHIRTHPGAPAPEDFGDLHGLLYRCFVTSAAFRQHFAKPPVICLSASGSRTYRRNGNQHPVLGAEYDQDERSFTDRYFEKMGCEVRFFMPPDSVAPLAFYFTGDLLADYSNLELVSTIATMETFQKIYRPEIYNANSSAGKTYQPSLSHDDFSLTQIVYDREERSRLAVEQGRFAEEHFIKPHQAILAQWSAGFAA